MRLFAESGYTIEGNVLSKEDFRPFLGFGHTTLNPERMGEIVKAAEGCLDEPLLVLPISRYRDFAVNGNRANFESLYFKRRNRLVNLAMAEIYERRGRFMEALVDTVWAILEETTWLLPAHNKHNPNNSDGVPMTYGGASHGVALFGASTGATLAYIYTQLKDEFDAITPAFGKRITEEVHARCTVPFLTIAYGWSGEGGGRPNNWNPWVISEVLLASALLSEDMAEREATLRLALKYSDNFINGYAPDGGCDEGPGYWSGAGLAYFTLLCVVYDLTGGKINLLSHPLVKKIGEYVVKVHIAGDYFVNNADCALCPGVNGASLRLFAERVNSDLMREMGLVIEETKPYIMTTGIVNPYRMHLALSLPLPKGHTEIVSPLSVYFENLKIALMRESTDASRGLCLVMKGGTNGESHNHNDIGQIYLYADGEPVLVDMGGMQYTKKTFSPERYTIMAMRSTYHNTATVDGGEQRPGESFCSTDEVFDAEQRTVRMQLKNAYAPESGILDFTRCATLGEGTATVSDTFAFDTERELDVHYLSAVEPTVGDGACVTLAEGVTLKYPSEMTLHVEKIALDDANLQANWKRPYLYMMHFTVRTAGGTFTFSFDRQG